MFSTRTSALLLLFAVISAGGEIITPALFQEGVECMVSHCTEKIEVCQELYGEDLTRPLKGCIVNGCKGSAKRCLEGVVQGFVAAKRSEYPILSAETIQFIVETVMEIVVDSYLPCFVYTDFENTTQFTDCFLRRLVDAATPYINIISSYAGISKPGLVSCLLRRTVKQMSNCYNLLDKDFYTMYDVSSEWERTFNPQDYYNCYSKVFTEKRCFQMFSRIFGPTPAMLTQSKGLFVCIINELVMATAEC